MIGYGADLTFSFLSPRYGLKLHARPPALLASSPPPQSVPRYPEPTHPFADANDIKVQTGSLARTIIRLLAPAQQPQGTMEAKAASRRLPLLDVPRMSTVWEASNSGIQQL
ncbi:hypothetical protein EsH8_VIII_000524 [Colletotrichum jinshuiense]